MASISPEAQAGQVLTGLSDEHTLEVARQRVRALVAERQALARLNDPVAWVQREFFVPELHGPLILQPYQQAVLREAHRRDADGKFVYSTVVWSDIKKSIKSTIAAAVALYRGFGLEWGSIIIIANDLKQADSRVGYYLRRAIELNPKMRSLARIRNYRVILPNNTEIESVAIDPSGEAGSNADLVVFSELWGAHQQAQLRMWTEMTLPPNKYGHSQRWVETYAGFSGESPLLEQLYHQGVREGYQLDLGVPGLEVYANDRARLLCLWNTTPRNPWQTKEYYTQESATLPANEFERIHRNQWISSEESFVPPEWWDECQGEIPPAQPGETFVFALDAGVASDCFGIVGVSRRGDKVYVRYIRKWTPPLGRRLDFAPIETEVRRITDVFPVQQIAYDEYQLHDLCTRLKKEHLAWFRVFSQGAQRSRADKNLQDMIREGRIVHDGNPELREHVLNANSKTDGEKLRLVKRSDALKIDLAVCLSMAAWEATRLHIG